MVIKAFIEMVQIECCECNMVFTVTKEFNDKRLEDGKGFNCPSGHVQYYSDSKLKKALKEIEKLKKELGFQKNRADGWYNSYLIMEKSRNSYKGHFTRLKNKLN